MIDQVKNFTRPPFANYDVVVYFGGGLFVFPIINRYVIEQFKLTLPEISLFGSQYVIFNTIVMAVSFAYTLYIMGHIIAYCSGQLIEKYFDSIFGFTSTAIVISNYIKDGKNKNRMIEVKHFFRKAKIVRQNRNRVIRAFIWYNLVNKYMKNKSWPAIVIRTVVHAPVLWIYMVIYNLNIFGYYNTKIPVQIFGKIQIKFKKLGFENLPVNIYSDWFKIIDYYVKNKNINVNDRMYNYFTIHGLFRTLCLILLFAIWLEVFQICYYFYHGEFAIEDFLTSGENCYYKIFSFSTFLVSYMFCVLSYLKFRRRYVEEAIFAFVLSD